MKHTFTLSLLLFTCILFSQSFDTDLSVQLSAQIDPNAPSITLQWLLHDDATTYSIHRKLKNQTSWGPEIAELDGSENTFTDTEVEVGEAYEYRVIKSGNLTGYGYIYAGVELPAINYRGRLLLLIDSTYDAPLQNEIHRLIRDIEGDGWSVTTHFISPAQSVPSVKDTIINWYDLAPDDSEAIFLLGHIPVPYSGNIAPDGHNDHQGAWPADAYYGDINGNWTDFSINNTSAGDMRNHNVPGDGKFDQSIIPSDIELQVGRVDLSNLPAFQDNEIELTRTYLDKNHAFRNGQINVTRRGMIENNFGSFNEGFAQNGWKNFSTMFGPDSVSYQDYLSTLNSESYMWSYGCGAGSYTSCGGVINTNQFATDSVQTIFTILFGSYFGDWDRSNNLLRAALGSGTVLANFWAGRPNWQVHHMALGETIGYSTRLSQNNSTITYTTGFGARNIHISLMGDPSLRMHYLKPIASLDLEEEASHVQISWDHSQELNIIGYHIFRKETGTEDLVRLTNTPVSGLNFVDSCLQVGSHYTYSVRPVKLELSASGTYYNMGTGISDTITITEESEIVAGLSKYVNDYTVEFENLSANAVSLFWDFGNNQTSSEENPTVTYAENGTYLVTLIATNNCGLSDTLYTSVTIEVSSIFSAYETRNISIYPNPATSEIFVSVPGLKNGQMAIFSTNGKIMARHILKKENQAIKIGTLPKGMYLVRVADENKNWYITKLLVQ